MQSIDVLTDHTFDHTPFHESDKGSVRESGSGIFKSRVGLDFLALFLECPHTTWTTEIRNTCMRGTSRHGHVTSRDN